MATTAPYCLGEGVAVKDIGPCFSDAHLRTQAACCCAACPGPEEGPWLWLGPAGPASPSAPGSPESASQPMGGLTGPRAASGNPTHTHTHTHTHFESVSNIA